MADDVGTQVSILFVLNYGVAGFWIVSSYHRFSVRSESRVALPFLESSVRWGVFSHQWVFALVWVGRIFSSMVCPVLAAMWHMLLSLWFLCYAMGFGFVTGLEGPRCALLMETQQCFYLICVLFGFDYQNIIGGGMMICLDATVWSRCWLSLISDRVFELHSKRFVLQFLVTSALGRH